MNNNDWLTLSEYSTQYKVSVSTLRRRIKSKKVNCTYEDGKYFLRNLPLNEHKYNNTNGDLTHHQQVTASKATIAPPQLFSSKEVRKEESLQIDEEHIQNKLNVEPAQHSIANMNEVSANVKFLVKELKDAYTLNLKEKEEQLLILKDEITDLKMLVHALEDQNKESTNESSKVNNKTKQEAEPLMPQPIELEYIPTPNIELAKDWLEDDI